MQTPSTTAAWMCIFRMWIIRFLPEIAPYPTLRLNLYF